MSRIGSPSPCSPPVRGGSGDLPIRIGVAAALFFGATCAQHQLPSVIGRRISADQRLCRYAIQVTSAGGVVYLDGIVGGPIERARAETIAREAGASRVTNRVVISAGSADRGRC
jgi:osmotically-inducible protein OsmY